MKSVSHDARGFVEGVVHHLKKGGKNKDIAPKVQSLLYKMSASAKNERKAVVESAVKLSSKDMQDLSRILATVAGHEVGLTNIVRSDLVAGMRITMADWVMDASFKKELADMKRVILGS